MGTPSRVRYSRRSSSRFCNGYTRALGQLSPTGVSPPEVHWLAAIQLQRFNHRFSVKGLHFRNLLRRFCVLLPRSTSRQIWRSFPVLLPVNCRLDLYAFWNSIDLSSVRYALNFSDHFLAQCLQAHRLWSFRFFRRLDTSPASFTDRLAKIQMNSCSITDD